MFYGLGHVHDAGFAANRYSVIQARAKLPLSPFKCSPQHTIISLLSHNYFTSMSHAKRSRCETCKTFSSWSWASASSRVSKMVFHGAHCSYLFQRTSTSFNRLEFSLRGLLPFQMVSTNRLMSTDWSTNTYIPVYTVSQKKVSQLMFNNNFGKCGSIFKILSPGDS